MPENEHSTRLELLTQRHIVIPINLSGYKHRHLSCTSLTIKSPVVAIDTLSAVKLRKLSVCYTLCLHFERFS